MFNFKQENVLVEYIKDMENHLFELTQQSVRKLAFQLADRNGIQHTYKCIVKQLNVFKN
ncbi:tigger transposable element-derived protein 6-like [Aphis craccivora]|uniref:Tigger transposable element-derived protein 6-like n=1 Tax=Aphis craccivora TaxID=307492 RepID=A0A6G0YHH8_APHCR|nr:tigger transposable element-derived protein 6-like [Aphis craccivora]